MRSANVPQGERRAGVSTDLEAAVARLKRDLDAIAAETPGAKEARGDVRLLLADWERRRKDAEYAQNAVDTVIHYRNLAIKCGAAPDDMLGAYDRKLCVDHNPNDRDGYDFSGNRETWAEVEKVTAERDAARAEVERLHGHQYDPELGSALTVAQFENLTVGEWPAHYEEFAATVHALARLRERDAKVREAVYAIYAHYPEGEVARAGEGSQLWWWAQAIALLKETP